MRTKFYWTQRFPARKTVVIEHSYQPISGNYNSASYFAEPGPGAEFCVDWKTRLAIEAMGVRDDLTGRRSSANDTDYILKTAKTWNGPIGRFHLMLDKMKPENLLSLCWPGDLKKAGPTTFEYTAEQFTPNRDIHLLVLE